MVSKIKTLPQQEKEGAPEKDCETLADSQLAGLSDAAVKKLIRSVKKRGYVTHDQINSVLPPRGGQFRADRGRSRHVRRDGR
jgi:RNA polymerase primary sigma factor